MAYKITYVTNGGSAVEEQLEQTKLPDSLPTTVKEGYNFGGWKLDESLEIPAIPSAELTGDTILYALWKTPIYRTPTMEWSIKINGASVPSGGGTVSEKENYNNIAITYKCTNQSLMKYEVWVTLASVEDWGKGIGVKALENVNSLAKNTNRTDSITATKTIFSEGDGLYRLALCAKGDLDGTWDVTEVLMTVKGLVMNDNEIWQPTDSDAVEMVVSDLDGHGGGDDTAIAGKAIAGKAIVGRK